MRKLIAALCVVSLSALGSVVYDGDKLGEATTSSDVSLTLPVSGYVLYTDGTNNYWGLPGTLVEVDPIFTSWLVTNTYVQVELDPIWSSQSNLYTTLDIFESSSSFPTWPKSLIRDTFTKAGVSTYYDIAYLPTNKIVVYGIINDGVVKNLFCLDYANRYAVTECGYVAGSRAYQSIYSKDTDNFIYGCGNGGILDAVDFSDPNAPVRTAYSLGANQQWDLVSNGSNLLFVTEVDGGLFRAFTIASTNPATLTGIYTNSTGGYNTGVDYNPDANVVYHCNYLNAKVYSYTISGTTITKVSEVTCMTTPNKMCYASGYLYVTKYGGSKLDVFNVQGSNATNPVRIVSEYSLPGVAPTYGDPVVSGDVLYIGDETAGTLNAFDVANPTNLYLIVKQTAGIAWSPRLCPNDVMVGIKPITGGRQVVFQEDPSDDIIALSTVTPKLSGLHISNVNTSLSSSVPNLAWIQAQGYLTSFLESDPIWTAVSNTVISQASNGQTAFGWGNHALAGYVSYLGITNTLLPTSSNTFDLGSASFPFRDLYLGGDSVYMQGVKVLSYDSTNGVLVSEVTLVGSGGTNDTYLKSGMNVSELINDAGYITAASAGITNGQSNVTLGTNFDTADKTLNGEWFVISGPVSGNNSILNLGNFLAQAKLSSVPAPSPSAGYVLHTDGSTNYWSTVSYSETDPVWSVVSNTVMSNAANGQTAFGWGNHATNGYLTSEALFTSWLSTNTYVQTETDPVFSSWLGTNTYVQVELDPNVTNYVRQAVTLAPDPISGYVLATDGNTSYWATVTIPAYYWTNGSPDITVGDVTAYNFQINGSSFGYYNNGSPEGVWDYSARTFTDAGGWLVSLGAGDWVFSTPGFIITNSSSGQKVLEIQNAIGTLHAPSTGYLSYDWQNQLMYDGATVLAADFANRKLYDNSTSTVDWLNCQLGTLANGTTLDWASGQLRDITTPSILSLDWNNRLAYAADGTTVSIDWDAYQLLSSAIQPTVEWDAMFLNDASCVSSADWGSRQLLNSSGTEVLNWNSGVLTNLEWKVQNVADADDEIVNWQSMTNYVALSSRIRTNSWSFLVIAPTNISPENTVLSGVFPEGCTLKNIKAQTLAGMVQFKVATQAWDSAMGTYGVIRDGFMASSTASNAPQETIVPAGSRLLVIATNVAVSTSWWVNVEYIVP